MSSEKCICEWDKRQFCGCFRTGVCDKPAAPVLERQPVAYLDIGTGGYMDLGSDLPDEQLQALPNGRHMLVISGTYGVDGYVAPPELAELQATIARLTAENERLKGGQGEPVAYQIQAFSPDGHLRRHMLSWHSLDEFKDIRDYKEWIGELRAEETPLYASQPAPVSVTEEQFADAFRVTGAVTSGQAYDLAEIAMRLVSGE